VLAAGGGHPTSEEDVDHPDAQIYSPPYLYQGPRPVIVSAPKAVRYGQSFSVRVSTAAPVARATWMRLGSVTHGFDQSERTMELPIAPTAGGLTVTAPANANLSPPGYYMLFLVSPAGVPSVSAIVRIS
jgi:hypothetical protein